MAKKPLPTPEELRQRLRYDSETGYLFWRTATPEMFASGGHTAAHRCNNFNAAYAGKRAFTAIDAHGYHVGNFQKRCMKAHRIAWAMHFDAWPEADIDHINGVRTDNRIANLRDVSRSRNLANSKRPHGGTSRYRGVRNSFGKWEARISDDNVQISLGRFDCEVEAARAYDASALELWGDCATLNFPLKNVDSRRPTPTTAPVGHALDVGLASE